MLSFENPITPVQLLIPAVCTGMLAVGILISTYLSVKYRSLLYTSMSLLCFFAFCFVSCETLILTIGGMLRNPELSVSFHRVEQLSGAFFIFGLPLLIGTMLELGGIEKKINNTLCAAGLAFSLICALSFFFYPDLFISSEIHKQTWLINEADYGRGKEGPLYYMRDILLTALSVYAVFSISRIIKKRGSVSYFIYPLAGMTAAIAGGAVDSIFVYTGVNYDFFPHEYFSRFSLGITSFALSVVAGLITHYVNVAMYVDNANRKISVSEKKYRVLVEGTTDFIFTLDSAFNILSANRSATKKLAFAPASDVQKNLTDILRTSGSSGELDLRLIKEKLEKFKKYPAAAVSFTSFIELPDSELEEYIFTLESVSIDSLTEIIAKATPVLESITSKHLICETQEYEMGNSLYSAEELSRRLVRNLSKFMNPREINILRIGLREIIINAIEHGNLNISFEEKTEASMSPDYINIILERQKDPEYSARKIIIKYSLTSGKAVYDITDSGSGFDHEKILHSLKEKADQNELAHGRGITMARSIFDKITYHGRGNRVVLEKHFTAE